ncbi:catalase/peroxidase HPI [Luminiphilus sp.]|nr:catalase/peroxidase HPI [Luminiphilus sp.]MDA8731698.1 catalase/peroxidase HPI [Luminiphilus sp.]MDA9666713.1 catalase/peroxidase HPI [Luminiphilus sp.]MDA9797487.1 catalase/peroxidase HPI [Luminiphilus sp.]
MALPAHDVMARSTPKSAQAWWPTTLDLTPLRQNEHNANPLGASFDYASAFATLDLEALKADVNDTLTQSQAWWPADYGNYGPFFVRMAWHSAGTYRTGDGRGGADGGQQRFEPLNSWPDNGNLDKARRLLWPIKQKYGSQISWADLMVLAGNVAMENMGFKTFGFAGGRTDDWEPEWVYWGPEAKMLADERYGEGRQLRKGLAAVQMGLIYVNPEGPNGNPDPVLAAHDIRETFGRMAMNDEETVALIAGGHSFGKAHGAHKPDDCVGPEPTAEVISEQGLGWKNVCGKGNAEDTVTSGLEGAWTATPTQWSIMYLANLFAYDWEQTRSPAGALQWQPKGNAAADTVPDAHLAEVSHAPVMFTTDLSLKFDPSYREISQRFLANPQEFELAFAKAWFKLTHRDMGPKVRYLGADVPEETLAWQDPLPDRRYKVISDRDIAKLKGAIAETGLSNTQLVATAWASAATYRGTDMRGGANGARIRLAPQNQWAVNDPDALSEVLSVLEQVQDDFNATLSRGKQVALADVIVLSGNVGVERAAAEFGITVSIPFTPGRVDALEGSVDNESMAVLEPRHDGFRNYMANLGFMTPAQALIDKADRLNLTVSEMTVLLGGMRGLNANAEGSTHGVLTDRPGVLSNDFFIHLLDMTTAWAPSDEAYVFEGRDRQTGDLKWTATEFDLVLGSNAELRAVVEFYAFDESRQRFVKDFASAWTKVMNADRFDIEESGNVVVSVTP